MSENLKALGPMMLADLNPAMTMMGVTGVSPHTYTVNNPHPGMTKSVGSLAISDKIICVPISSSIRTIYDLCKQLGPLEQFFGDQSGPLIR